MFRKGIPLLIVLCFYTMLSVFPNPAILDNGEYIHFRNHIFSETDLNTSLNYYLNDDIDSIIIPLKRAGNLILLEAIVDSIPGNLILDTGASTMVLNSIYFRDGRRTGSVAAGGITGSAIQVTRSRVRDLQISQITFSGVGVNIADLGHLEQARNIRILGFFGLSLFTNFEVVIDLKNNVLELHRTDSRGNRVVKNNAIPRFDFHLPIKIESNVVFFDAVINRRKLTFCLDTGAESNVLSSQLPGSVLNTVEILRRANLKGAGSQSMEVLYGKMNDFSINRSQFKGMNVIITNLNTMSQYYGITIDGMMGCDFLEQGQFFINLKQQKLGIVLNN